MSMPEAEILRNAQEPEGGSNPEVEEQRLLVGEDDTVLNIHQDQVAEAGADVEWVTDELFLYISVYIEI